MARLFFLEGRLMADYDNDLPVRPMSAEEQFKLERVHTEMKALAGKYGVAVFPPAPPPKPSECPLCDLGDPATLHPAPPKMITISVPKSRAPGKTELRLRLDFENMRLHEEP